MYIYHYWGDITLPNGRVVTDYELTPANFMKTSQKASFSSDWWSVASLMRSPEWAANKYKAAHDKLRELGQLTNTYKDYVRRLVDSIINDGATHVGAYCDTPEYYFRVPPRKNTETIRGYKSRLSAWVHYYALRHAAFNPEPGLSDDEHMTNIVDLSSMFVNIARPYRKDGNEYTEIEYIENYSVKVGD